MMKRNGTDAGEAPVRDKQQLSHVAGRAILLALAAALAAYQLVAACSMYPAPGGDATTFIPPAVNLEAGRGLTNTLWSFYADPSGQHRFLEHLPFFAQALALCMWEATSSNAFFVLAIFNALTICAYAAFLCARDLAPTTIGSLPRLMISCMSLLAVSFFVFNSSAGRPEALTALLMITGVAALIWLPRVLQLLVCGGAIGAAAAAHPTHGIFLGCLFAVVVVRQRTLAGAVRDLVVAAALAFAVFWLLFLAGPFGIRETLQAVAAHGSAVNAADYKLSSLVTYYVRLAPWSGIYLIVLFIAAAWAGLHMWRTAPDRTARAAQLAALVLTMGAIWFFAIRTPNKSMYVTMLAPAIALALFYLASETAPGRFRLCASLAAVGGCAVLALFPARDASLFGIYLRAGVSFTQAKQEFEELRRATSGTTAVSESLWVLADGYDRVQIVLRGASAGDLMIVQQAQRVSLTPPEFPQYEMVANRFVPHRPTVFGVPLGRTVPGYAFAAYRRRADSGVTAGE